MFPDIANVEFIRTALWRHKFIGNAAIMIGAGFSRNADPVSDPSPPMPSWAEMARTLCHPLYGSDKDRLDASLREAAATSGFLRLAEEYEAAFGTTALNGIIKGLVPDLNYRPGELHKRLLRLPWADVFTTNWDTLLERACSDVFNRDYDVVRTIQQIPYAMRPRIVKLHGTLPAHQPFIFTGEDYRRFPVRFAPFVNLVQQSMMENIFCLLGFSGDDPNFLHWSGWVRDNLADEAPKIYLVGWLELSVHRRRMLEMRNVMPIDLSLLPQGAHWPPDLRHRYATEWFLRTLEEGAPYNVSDWPAPAAPAASVPIYLAPIPRPAAATPLEEHWPQPGRETQAKVKALNEVIAAWAHNRELYPGWMIAPEHVRKTLWDRTAFWGADLLGVLKSLSRLEQLRALSEFTWRLDRSLYPLFSDLEDYAFSALEAVDWSNRKVAGTELPKECPWSTLVGGATGLALALIRNARHAGDVIRFERAIELLAKNPHQSPVAAHAITYERCLWLRSTGDLPGLTRLLEDWRPTEGETPWLLRKAGLLAELGEDYLALGILEPALLTIRRTRRRDCDDIVSLSRESWALYLAQAYRLNRFFKDGPNLSENVPQPFQRWRELGLLDCDAFVEYHALERALQNPKPDVPDVTRRVGFDPDHEGVTYHMGQSMSPALLAAYQIVLLAEVTGLPPSTNHVNLIKDGLSAAAKVLARHEPFVAADLAVRIGSDEVLDSVFSRPWVASLPQHLVIVLRDAMLKRIAFGVSFLGSTDKILHAWVNRTGDAIEVLSRLSVRLPTNELELLLQESLTYYRSPVLRRRSVHLGTSLQNLFKRVLESLPSNTLDRYLPDIFALPLTRERGLEADHQRWTEPSLLLPQSYRPVQKIGSSWSSIVARLLEAASSDNKPNREAALFRLYRLWSWKWLGEEEAQSYAKALWDPALIGQGGLPSHEVFHPWAYLSTPIPKGQEIESAISQYIHDLANAGTGDIYSRLKVIGILLLEARRLKMALPLEPTKPAFRSLITAWAATRLSDRPPGMFGAEEDQREQDALVGVNEVLAVIDTDDEIVQAVWNKAQDLDAHHDRNVRAYMLYPLLTSLHPDRATELTERLRRALASDQKTDAKLGVLAVYEWTSNAMRAPDKFVLPESELFKEIGISIAARRAVILRTAIDIACWMFNRGPKELANTLAQDCEFGLQALLDEASYARLDPPFDVPGVRAASVRLAVAMRAAGFGTARGVNAWIESAAGDPLPEVRNAIRGQELGA